MKVKIYFKKDSPYGEETEELSNITEIHYNFPSVANKLGEKRIAFESDINKTGLTYNISHIREFEAK